MKLLILKKHIVFIRRYEKVHLYFARVNKVAENIDNDSCTTIEVSLDDVVDYIKNQDILDGKSIVAISFLKNNIENLGV